MDHKCPSRKCSVWQVERSFGSVYSLIYSSSFSAMINRMIWLFIASNIMEYEGLLDETWITSSGAVIYPEYHKPIPQTTTNLMPEISDQIYLKSAFQMFLTWVEHTVFKDYRKRNVCAWFWIWCKSPGGRLSSCSEREPPWPPHSQRFLTGHKR